MNKKTDNVMILAEEHIIRCGRQRDLYRRIDGYCYSSKNLYNSANYLITQCSRISRKLKNGEILDSWEKGLAYRTNCAILHYNHSGKKVKQLRYIDEHNGFIADAYFLSWYLKGTREYKAMPYAACAQICIQELCRAWRSFYRGMDAWKKGTAAMTAMPRRPGYKDRDRGRNALVLTYQNIRVDENGCVKLPSFLDGIHIRARHKDIKQVRILAEEGRIRILLMYPARVPSRSGAGGTMGIDLGVDNLMTLCMDTEAEPVIINGRGVKSINRSYNKRKALLQSAAKKANGKTMTGRIAKLTQKRNRKIRDCMHKASRKVIQIAQKEGIGTIIIGNNRGWKQKADMGNRTNQAFVSIPYKMLIDQIRYKAALAGIEVKVVEESYTSGTSYIDGEFPCREAYDSRRRIKRGLFRSNNGLLINADVNAAYQIMKKEGCTEIRYKGIERTVRLNVS